LLTVSATGVIERATPVPLSSSTLAISPAEADVLFASLANEKALIVAVSGGPDSTALMVLITAWRKRRRKGPKLIAVTVDHGLRTESAREAAAVKRLARRIGITHQTLHWRGAKPKTGLQEQARHERYRLLGAAAKRAKARCVLTAHTLDDQAETVLMRMARGSGISGLAAMATVTPVGDFFVVRPLLGIAKARLTATLDAENIPYANDPSNRDPRFTRVRVRVLMPTLAAEGLSPRRLAVLARRLRRADAAVEAAASEAGSRLTGGNWPRQGAITLDRTGFAELPEELALRLLGRAITQCGDEGPVELAKLEVLTEFVRSATAARVRRRRTQAGAVVTVDKALTIDRAPPRRYRAVRPKSEGATSRRSK
jgi:tRNA(Ile)-lysidine synthase